MRRILIVFLFLFPLFIHSQPINFDDYRIENGKKADSSANVFRKILNQQFSSLVTGQSKNMFGSFGAVDINAGEVSFAGSHVSKKTGSVFNVKGSGGISDGFHSIFSNSELNTNISLDLKYHFMSLKKKMLEYDADTADNYNEKINAIQYDFNSKTIDIKNRVDSLNLERKKLKTLKQISDLDDSIKKANDSLKILLFKNECDKNYLLLDSIYNALKELPGSKSQNRNLRNRVLEKLEGLSLETGILGFSYGWFTIGYKVNNNKFKSFNGQLPYSQQVRDTSFVSHAFNFQYSKYYLRAASFNSYFWDIGLNFTYSDNFSSLKKRELSETTEFGTTTGQRKATRTYNVYEGKYNKGKVGLTLYGDLYYFLFKNNIGAFHLNPEYVIVGSEKPVANLYTGFLFAVKSAKTANSVVNFELYYKFLDLFKATDSEYNLFERNNVGLRFAFPISFKYNKID